MAPNYPTIQSPLRLFCQAFKVLAGTLILSLCQTIPAFASTVADTAAGSNSGGGCSEAWSVSPIQDVCPAPSSFGPPPLPPSNDDPCGATALTVAPHMACTAETQGTLANATQSAVPSSPCAGNPNDDVWFQFTATGPTHYVFINNVVGNVTDLVLGVYSGSCGSLTNIRCIHALNFSVTDLIPGDPYWVRVFSYPYYAGANTTFDVCVTTPPPPPLCGGMYYDDGGPSGQYFDNTEVATTICPSTPGGIVSLVFSSFQLDFSDEFAVFDGSSTAAPFMNAYYGNGSPGTLTATNPTGCLTVAFYSDGDENYAGWAAQVTCSEPLPVELIALEATPDHRVIDITWETATERDSHHFTVERSPDNVTFTPIGTVAAAGNTQFPKNYVFVDEVPIWGVNYYRLEQVDINGSTTRTRTVVAVLSSLDDQPSIYPNPASDVLNVAFPKPLEMPVKLVVLDALGRNVAATTTDALPGQRTAQVPVEQLAPGWYTLRIERTDGGFLKSAGFLKN
ncbi:MAG: T9SS type A sorting domain-containing protein [Flavobacteriales bacterium]